MIMKVRTISNARYLNNAPLMLNLENERFIGNIDLKRFFKMALISEKNFVYNTLARQTFFCFINAISSLVVLTYRYHCYYYYYHYRHYYYYHSYYCFVVIIANINVFSITNVIHFILFLFIFYC